MTKLKTIVVSVISELTTDQRVIRISTTLQQMGFDVQVIARELNNSLPLGNYSFKASRIKCFFKKGVMQYLEFNLKLLLRLLFIKTDYLLANDLDTLAPNYMVSKLRGKKLFYDTHEYFTGVPELAASPVKKKIWKSLENLLLPRLPVIYTVNESVKNKYESEYPGIHLGIVRNIPATAIVTPVTPPAHWAGKIILLMQGIGIHPGRGGMELLQALPYLPEQYQLVYIGGGLAWDAIDKARRELQLTDRVDMISKLPPEQLKAYTPLAQLGFTLDGFENENYLFNLPNKLFDYIHAGVPVAATPIPEVKRIIEQYGCGFCFDSILPQQMAATIEAFMSDIPRYNKCKAQTQLAASELCWEREQEQLMDIYKPYLH